MTPIDLSEWGIYWLMSLRSPEVTGLRYYGVQRHKRDEQGCASPSSSWKSLGERSGNAAPHFSNFSVFRAWLGLALPMVLPIARLPGWGSGVDGWSSLVCLWSDIYVIPTEKMALRIKAGVCRKKEKAGMPRGWEKQTLTPDSFFGMVCVEFS